MVKNKNIFETCPHCGEKLSLWQQVLLSVDRSLMCKNCWYRIILNASNAAEKPEDQAPQQEEE